MCGEKGVFQPTKSKSVFSPFYSGDWECCWWRSFCGFWIMLLFPATDPGCFNFFGICFASRYDARNA
jgi:hypothetical protein